MLKLEIIIMIDLKKLFEFVDQPLIQAACQVLEFGSFSHQMSVMSLKIYQDLDCPY